EGKRLAWDLIATGRALAKFREMVEIQGGDPRVVECPILPRAQHSVNVYSRGDGFITAIQCEQVGIASLILGGGRAPKEDPIDPAVGLTLHKKVGDMVRSNELLCTIHYNSDQHLDEARHMLDEAFTVGEHLPETPRPLIHKIICGRNT